jgi:virginiamycin B lyase
MAGVVTEFNLPAGTAPTGIAGGPAGNMWFGEGKSAIGRITPAGAFTEFLTPTANTYPQAIAAGPDGNLWFTEFAGSAIGTITVAGAIVERAIPMTGSVEGITRGADGNLWFVETGRQWPQIGRVTPGGTFREFPIPTEFSNPHKVCLGGDGNVWFIEVGKVGRVTPAGPITEFPVTGAGTSGDIALGPDGNIWFAAGGGAPPTLRRITPTGTTTLFPLSALASAVAKGSDGNIWFTEPSFGTDAKIARFLLP